MWELPAAQFPQSAGIPNFMVPPSETYGVYGHFEGATDEFVRKSQINEAH